MEKITSFQNLKPNQTILLLSFDGRIKGIDTIKEINYETGHYDYLNQEGKNYQGNLKNLLEYNFGFIVDESIKEYNDQKLKSAILNIEWVFENMYGDNLGSFIRNNIISMIRKDFNMRIEFIDLINKYEKEIFNIRWEGDEECGPLTKEEVIACKSKVQEALNKASFFEFKI
jgi:hypothetical protein